MKNEHALRWTCRNGHLEVARWLFKLNRKIDIHVKNGHAFRSGCRSGHFELAHWYVQ
jgi:hypothetical protein